MNIKIQALKCDEFVMFVKYGKQMQIATISPEELPSTTAN